MSVWEQSLDAYSGGYDPERYQRPYRLEENYDNEYRSDVDEEDEEDEEE